MQQVKESDYSSYNIYVPILAVLFGHETISADHIKLIPKWNIFMRTAIFCMTFVC
jgi:hypothetical protein